MLKIKMKQLVTTLTASNNLKKYELSYSNQIRTFALNILYLDAIIFPSDECYQVITNCLKVEFLLLVSTKMA